MRKLRA